jgi:hypothetical protein
LCCSDFGSIVPPMEDEIKELEKQVKIIDEHLGDSIEGFKYLLDLINALPPEKRQEYLDKFNETLKTLSDKQSK